MRRISIEQLARKLKNGWPLFVFLGLFCFPTPTDGILFYGTGDPTYNTTAPSGALQGSGWQYEGQWGSFLGTAIAPHYFISAAHIGGNVGDVFSLKGSSYVTTAYFDDAQSDLRLWRVSGTIPSYASLYAASDEVGKSLVVFGRGTQRGDQVFAGGLASNKLKGWKWGAADGIQRWGQNNVASIATDPGNKSLLLRAAFDANGGPNEAHLSVGDSGGAVFINDGAGWKLAGINYTVDGAFNAASAGIGFEGALFDMGGLYEGSEGNWMFISNLPTAQPSSFYSTRISARKSWIDSVLASPVADPTPILQTSGSLSGPFQQDQSARVDTIQQSVSVQATAAIQFFRLQSASSLHIKSITREGSRVMIQYE